jgi:hypothetical protein
MIITRLAGGLGNQMFQYAAGLSLAQERRTVLKLDVSWFQHRPDVAAHNVYRLDCLNITEQFATRDEIEQFTGSPLSYAERALVRVSRTFGVRNVFRPRLPLGTFHSATAFHFYPEFFELPDNTMISGWWQSERFFAPVAKLLRLHFSFRYPPPPAVAEMAARIQSGPSAAIHFRRGDYVKDSALKSKIGVVSMDYYERAVALLRERSPKATLYIFSDDIEAVAQEFKPPGPHVFVRCVDHWHPWDKIRLMAACDHIAIANSSFSWWAAWLHPDPDRLVLAPTPWFSGNPEENPRDIVPDCWTRLPCGSSSV